ncbi:hypothetical protein EDC19_2731 [Natranaerovirga hydrolytica]|uniref:Uncharacterized protein n=1 Tax=Natranaerovirga hydrolytica TaxID=680378 RepID=A0A4R1M6L9_9FIRM|nr:hypothetical protein [Natranaerovirga hydrolytica]TCK87888.1 hypothetical protein EDC19_2731 [Natranaerovirga hydrolytica]
MKNKRNILIGLIIVATLTILLLITLVYNYKSVFQLEDVYNQVEDTDYETQVVNDTEIIVTLDEATFNYHLANNRLDDNGDLWVHFNEQKVTKNIEYKGLMIPVTSEFSIETNNNAIQLNYSGLKWGTWNIPVSLFDDRFNEYMIEQKGNLMHCSFLSLPYLCTITDAYINDEKLELVIEVDENKLQDLFQDLFEHYEEEVLLLYKESEDQYELIYDIFSNKNLQGENIRYYIEDFLEDNTLIKGTLALLTDDKIDQLFEAYPDLFKVEKETIFEMKADFLMEQQMNSFQDLYRRFYHYQNNNAANLLRKGNNPYDFRKGERITTEYIAQEYNLPITEDFTNQSEYIYDMEAKEIELVYYYNDYQVLVFKDESYETVPKEVWDNAVETYEFSPVKKPTREDEERKKIEEVIQNYWGTNKVFTRYLAIDSSNAFILVSHGVNYQNVYHFVLEKAEDEWIIVENNISDVYDFNKNNLEFNIELIPNYFLEEEEVLILSYNDRLMLVQDLHEREIIPSIEIAQLSYSSYAGNYITVKIADGREFIYTVSYGFLEDFYTKEEGINTLSGIPKIILLQD